MFFEKTAMKINFEISLNIKTCKGIETYGSFGLGEDEGIAKALYQSLLGDSQVTKHAVITIDLIRRENGIPYPLELKHCSYAQLAENVQIITRERFKQLNLEN